jgi:hypothetical protein
MDIIIDILTWLLEAIAWVVVGSLVVLIVGKKLRLWAVDILFVLRWILRLFK